MKNLFLNIPFYTFFYFSSMAQTKVTGEYRLVGIHDMAAGFRFSPQGTFDFFYIYGAVDRFAKGTYSVEGNTIKLKSEKEAGQDFVVKKQAKKGEGYTIKVLDANPMLSQYVKCIIFNGQEKSVEFMNTKGELHIPITKADKIYLQHELYPDIACEIKNDVNSNNYFEVALRPSLQQISFKGIDFTFNHDTLTCLPNYFMPFEKIKFVKN